MMLRHSRWSGRHIMPTGPGWMARDQRGGVAACLVWNNGQSTPQGPSISDQEHPSSNIAHDNCNQVSEIRFTTVNTEEPSSFYTIVRHVDDVTNSIHNGQDSGEKTNVFTTVTDHEKKQSQKLRSMRRETTRPPVTPGARHSRPHSAADVVTQPQKVVHNSAPKVAADCWIATGSTVQCNKVTQRGCDYPRADLRQEATRFADVSCSITWSTDEDGVGSPGNHTDGSTARQNVVNTPGVRAAGPKALRGQAIKASSAERSIAIDSNNSENISIQVTSGGTDSKHVNHLQLSRRSNGVQKLDGRRQESASLTTDKLNAQLNAALANFKYTTAPPLEDDVIDVLHRYLRLQQQSRKVTNGTSKSATKTQKLKASTSEIRPSTAVVETMQRVPVRSNTAHRPLQSRGQTPGRRRWHTTSTMNDLCRQRLIEFRQGDLGPLSDLMVIRSATPQPSEQPRSQNQTGAEVPHNSRRKVAMYTTPGVGAGNRNTRCPANGTDRFPVTDGVLPEQLETSVEKQHQPTRPDSHQFSRSSAGHSSLGVDGLALFKQCDRSNNIEKNEPVVLHKVPTSTAHFSNYEHDGIHFLDTIQVSHRTETLDRTHFSHTEMPDKAVDRNQIKHTVPAATVLTLRIGTSFP